MQSSQPTTPADLAGSSAPWEGRAETCVQHLHMVEALETTV